MARIIILFCSILLSGCGIYAQQQNLKALESTPVGTPKDQLVTKLSSPLGNDPCVKIGLIGGEYIESCPYILTFGAKAFWDNNIFFHSGKYSGKGNKTVFLKQYQQEYPFDSEKGKILVVRTYEGKPLLDYLSGFPKGSVVSVNLFSDGKLAGELFHDGAVLLDHDPGEIQLTFEQKGKIISDTKFKIEKSKNYTLYFDYLSGRVRLDGDESSQINITSNPPGAWVFSGGAAGKLSNIGQKTPFSLNRTPNSTRWANEYYQVILDGYDPSSVIFRDNAFGDRKINFDLKEKELTGLSKIEFEFKQELSSYEGLKKQNELSKTEYEKNEISFLNELNDEQVKAYSNYIDTYNDNNANIAKVILALREFSSKLEENKKDQFVGLYSEKKSIENGSELLKKMEENLDERKNSIALIKEEIAETSRMVSEEQKRTREEEFKKQQQLVVAQAESTRRVSEEQRMAREEARKQQQLAIAQAEASQRASEETRRQQQLAVAQNTQAAQSAPNALDILTILTTGLNVFTSVQTQKYYAQAQAYRNYTNQFESERQHRELVNSLKGIEDSITRARRGLW